MQIKRFTIKDSYSVLYVQKMHHLWLMKFFSIFFISVLLVITTAQFALFTSVPFQVPILKMAEKSRTLEENSKHAGKHPTIDDNHDNGPDKGPEGQCYEESHKSGALNFGRQAVDVEKHENGKCNEDLKWQKEHRQKPFDEAHPITDMNTPGRDGVNGKKRVIECIAERI